MQLELINVEQEVERSTVVGEVGAGAEAVNEDLSQDTFVAMYNVLGLYSVRVRQGRQWQDTF